MPRYFLPAGQVGPDGERAVDFPDDIPEDAIQAYINKRYAPVEPEPEPLDRSGIISKSVAKFKSGAASIGEGVGALTGVAGRAVGSDRVASVGLGLSKIFEDYSEQVLEGVPEDPTLASVFESEGLGAAALEAVRPTRLVPQVAEFLPQLILAAIPGGLAARAGGLAAKVTASASLGAIAGATEAVDVQKEVLERGGTQEQADSAFVASGITVGLLNAIGLGQALRGVGAQGLVDKVAGEVAKRGLGRKSLTVLSKGVGEAFTEFLEEPANIEILKAHGVDISSEEYKERLKAAIDVTVPAFAIGGGIGGVGEVFSRATEADIDQDPEVITNTAFTGNLDPVFVDELYQEYNSPDFKPQDEKHFKLLYAHLIENFAVAQGRDPNEFARERLVLAKQLKGNEEYVKLQQELDENAEVLAKAKASRPRDEEGKAIRLQDIKAFEENQSRLAKAKGALERDIFKQVTEGNVDLEAFNISGKGVAEPQLQQTEFNLRRATELQDTLKDLEADLTPDSVALNLRQELALLQDEDLFTQLDQIKDQFAATQKTTSIGPDLAERLEELSLANRGIIDELTDRDGGNTLAELEQRVTDKVARISEVKQEIEKLKNFDAQIEFPTLAQLDASARYDLPTIGLFHKAHKNLTLSDHLFTEGVITVNQAQRNIFHDLSKAEREALGVDEFLKEKGKTGRLRKGKRVVSREDLDAFVLENLVDVESFQVGTGDRGVGTDLVTSTIPGRPVREEGIYEPQHSQYISAGPSSNYQEHVLTVAGDHVPSAHFEGFTPFEEAANIKEVVEEHAANFFERRAIADAVAESLGRRVPMTNVTALRHFHGENLPDIDFDRLEELTRRNYELERIIYRREPTGSVLGWVRTTDREVKGKKFLHIEEVQSDIGQAVEKVEADSSNTPLSDRWTNVLMKRIVYAAATQGYDGVSIVQGKDNTTLPEDSNGAVFYDEKLPNVLKKLTGLKAEVGTLVEASVSTTETDPIARERPSIEATQVLFTPEVREKIGQEGFSLFQKGLKQHRGEAVAFIDKKTQQFTKVLLRGFLSPKATTGFHELAHAFTLLAEGDFKAELEQAAYKSNFFKGKKKLPIEKWKREHHEIFARGFEVFLLKGALPQGSKELNNSFIYVQDRLKELYGDFREIQGVLNVMDREVKQVYDMLFTGPLKTGAPAETGAKFGAIMTQLRAALSGEDSVGLADEEAQLPEKAQRFLNGLIEDKEGVKFAGEIIKALNKTEFSEPISTAERFQRGFEEAFKSRKRKKELSLDRSLAADYAALLMMAENHIQIIESEFIPEEAKQQAFDKMQALMQEIADQRTAAGRALQNVRTFNTFGRLLSSMGRMSRELTPEELEQWTNLDFGNLQQMEQFLQAIDATTPEGQAEIQQRARGLLARTVWYNSLLSNPGTQVTNFTTNTLWMGYLVGDRLLVSQIDKLYSKIFRRPRKTFATESLSLAKALGKGAIGLNPQGKRGAKAALIGALPEGIFQDFTLEEAYTKWDQEIGALSSVFLDLAYPDPKDPRRKQVNARTVAAGIAEGPSRVMIAVDLYMKGIAEMGEREALEKGRAEAKKLGPEAERAYINELFAQEKRKPSRRGIKDVTPESLEDLWNEVLESRVQRFMEHATFQDKPGMLTQRLINAREALNVGPFPLGRILIPFVQTIANLTKRGLEFTPGVGAIMAKQYGLTAAETTAKQLEGGLLIGLALMAAMSDDDDEIGALTGAPPQNKAKRDAWFRRGIQPYSVKLAGGWLDYRRFDPFGLVFSQVATYRQVLEDIAENNANPANEHKDGYDVLADMSFSLSKTLLDSTFLANPFNAIEGQHSAGRFVKRTVGSLVPYSGFLRASRRAWEAGNEGKVAVRENDGFLSTFGYIPLAGNLNEEPRLEALGQTAGRTSGPLREFLGVRYQPQLMDPVENELANLQVYPGMPSETMTINGTEVRIPDEMYREYTLKVGTHIKERLDQLFTRASYRNSQNPSQKERQVALIVDRVRSLEAKRLRGQLVRSGEFHRVRSLQQ